MNLRWTVAILALCGAVHADAEEDLLFAQRLGARGLTDMADAVLEELIQSGDPEKQRAGRYGKALIQKQQATIARGRFLLDLHDGREPRVPRAQVIAIYEDARPRIEEYVKSRGQAGQSAFLLGELLMEYAEFLTGAEYPDEMGDVRKQLVSENKDKAAELFEAAIQNFDAVAKSAQDDFDRRNLAEFQSAIGRFRWALIYPGGVNFISRIGDAIEALDTLYNKNYETLLGAYALLYLGRANYESGLREGDDDAGSIALDYFNAIYTQVEEDPEVPGTSVVLAESFYWYTKAALALARGEGKLKKTQPIYFDNAIAIGNEIRARLKVGARNRWALLAQLEVADAHAARGNFDGAVAIAGDVLAAARAENDGRVQKTATAKLTGWVASVTGAGALDPGLLFQIGESLNAQDRIANAITFYEKAVSASTTAEAMDRWGHNAWFKVAQAYRKDGRPMAAGMVAWRVVEDFLKSGADEDSAYAETASEACNVARLAWKRVSEATKDPAHEATYRKVLDTFRKEFPGHRENSDAAYAEALDVYTKGRLEEAAGMFLGINPNSPNYWRAQRRVPTAYRRIAIDADDEAETKKFYEKSLDAAEKLIELAKKDGGERAKAAQAHGELFRALALGALERWEPALAAMDAYLKAYPGKFPARGLEYNVKIRAHLALGQLAEAEAALATLKETLPDSQHIRGSNAAVFEALETTYNDLGGGKERRALAARAAKLWEFRVEREKDVDPSYIYKLGQVLRDAHDWSAAAEAFETAAEQVTNENVKRAYTLQAAMMAFRAIEEDPSIKGTARIKEFKRVRELFTDVIMEDKAKQADDLKVLANPNKWPSREVWGRIKNRPEILLDTASVFKESSPAGLDGRWIGVRLIDHLHKITKPVKDESKPQFDKYVNVWWDGVELKLELLAMIAESNVAASAKAGSDGAALINKLKFQYPDMDGPDRVTAIQKLEVRFQKLN